MDPGRTVFISPVNAEAHINGESNPNSQKSITPPNNEQKHNAEYCYCDLQVNSLNYIFCYFPISTSGKHIVEYAEYERSDAPKFTPSPTNAKALTGCI